MESGNNTTCPRHIWQVSMAELSRALGVGSSGVLNAIPRSLDFTCMQRGAMEGLLWVLFVFLCLECGVGRAMRNRYHAQGN